MHIIAGPLERKHPSELVAYVPEFAGNVIAWIQSRDETYDVVHSHYWLSGRTGVRLKNALGVPLANSFHTLGKVKDASRGTTETTSLPERLLTEEEVIAASDCVIASTPFEFDDLLEHYSASPERLCVSPPGVDHSVFRPGDRRSARAELGLGEERIVLYVGRIQSHKGTQTAVETLAELPEYLEKGGGPVVLHIVGGASGTDGEEELERCRAMVMAHGLEVRVRWFEPVPHATLVKHYQAADVVLMPSRSETFGLVAAEAQACGIPVVASNTGGLPYVVKASETGLLVDGHDPRSFAAALRAILDHPSFARRLSTEAETFSQRFSWDATARRMLELYEGISA